MMTIDKLHKATALSVVEARRVAEQNQASDEDGWKYVVHQVGEDRAFVHVHDSDGNMTGAL